MAKLINKKDSLCLKESELPESAMFYKDMLAFCDAYNKFVGYGVKNLPNYCFINNKIYLDGMCLLIKDYSSEFDFETLDLTMEYLRVLYFGVASFSVDGNFPEKSVIQEKYEEKQFSNRELYEKTTLLVESAQDIYDNSLNKYEMQASLNDKLQSKSSLFLRFSIIFLVLGIVFCALFNVLWVLDVFNKIFSILVSILFFILGIVFFILCRMKRTKILKELDSRQEDTRLFAEDKNEKLEKLKAIIKRKNQINNQKYSFIYCINNIDLLNDNTDYKELLAIATQYNMLSYNLEYDVQNTFKTHDSDIKLMIKTLTQIPNNNELFNELNKCYLEIVRKNWLYYNRYVRYCFIDKMIVSAKTNNNWQVYYNDEYVDPFNIDIKSIAQERVAFLENENSLFVEMPLNRIFNIESVKNDKTLKIKKDPSFEELKLIQMNYANKFYNLKEIKKLPGLFYSETQSKINKKKTLERDLIEGKNVIPDLFIIKFSLIEAMKKFEDSYLPVISELNEKILLVHSDDDDDDLFEYTDESIENIEKVGYLDLKDITTNNVNCENISENEDGSVEYYFDGKKLIGYKF